MTPRTTPVALATFAALALALAPAPASAQAGHDHVEHVSKSFGGTPDGAGLLATARAEAEIALQHARLAAGSEDLDAIKRHVGHVVHAVRPPEDGGGPGQGYGLLRAAEGVAAHIGMAAEAEGAADAIKTHSEHVATAARNVAMWAESVLEKAQDVESAMNAAEATALAEGIVATLEAVVNGKDADGDGRTGWGEGEGGLAQAEQHLELLLKAVGSG